MQQDSAEKGWLSRNWKWVVPVGCLGLIVMFAGFIAVIFLAVTGAVRSSHVYEIAMSEAQRHPGVIDALGEPIEAGWLVSGNISIDGTSGKADLAIPLEGPRGSGTLYVVADKVAGQWEFERMEVELDATMERVSLSSDRYSSDR